MPSHTPAERKKRKKRKLGAPRGAFVKRDHKNAAKKMGRDLFEETFSGAARTLGITRKVNRVKKPKRVR